jgi:hypothetical protein
MQENFAILCAGAAESAELTPWVGWANSPYRLSRLPKSAKLTLLWLVGSARRGITKSAQFDFQQWHGRFGWLEDSHIAVFTWSKYRSWWSVQKSVEFILHHELNRRITEDMSLRCLGFDQARTVMGKVYGLWSSSSRKELG